MCVEEVIALKSTNFGIGQARALILDELLLLALSSFVKQG